eukprot:1152301-Pelagomonas_calceolata.AAC.4
MGACTTSRWGHGMHGTMGAWSAWKNEGVECIEKMGACDVHPWQSLRQTVCKSLIASSPSILQLCAQPMCN